MDLKKLCFELGAKAGVSGCEADAAAVAGSYLEKYMSVRTDSLGNVVGTTQKGKYRIMLDAHLDRIGLVVKGFDDNGFVLFDRVGGVDLRVLTGAEVILHGKSDVFGVICSVPPHLSKNEEKKLDINSMAIDTGFCKDEICNIVSIGDRVTLKSGQYELLGDKISSGAFDDRCAIAAILYALELIDGKLNNIELSVIFSSREETGGSGAKTGAFSVMPDSSIVIDVGFGDDPYTSKTETIELGKGPSIGISPVLDAEFTNELISIAKKKNIPYQHDVMGRTTGTNADGITVTGAGVKTALLSIPLRYMHTANEVISISDVEATGRLIAEYLLEKEATFND